MWVSVPGGDVGVSGPRAGVSVPGWVRARVFMACGVSRCLCGQPVLRLLSLGLGHLSLFGLSALG